MSRLERVNQQLKREISFILQRDLSDPRLAFVFITRAGITKDLKLAKVYFRVIGNDEKVRLAKDGLTTAKGMIRKLIGERMKMRYTPELNFFYDESVEQSERIEEILEDIHHNEHSQDR